MMNQMLNNNPLYKRAVQMTQGKSKEEINQTIDNLCKQRGIDVQNAYGQFKQFAGQFGIKL